MRKNIILLLLVVFASCKDIKNKEIAHLVETWKGKEILFPKHPEVIILEHNFNNPNLRESNYSIVTYADSAGCIGCKLKLRNWATFMQQLDSITKTSIPVHFFLHTSNRKEIISILQRYNFTYPVYIDEKDSINKLNHFPVDDRFQTFLLNKENKVIAIGNPIHNPKIKELYLNILSGKEVPTKTEKQQTAIQLSNNILDMGKFNALKAQSKELIVRNTGNYPLVISEAVTSCGCLSVEYNKTPIPPGESTKLKVIYKAEKPEHFNKTITIYGNMLSSPIVVKIKGDAV